MKREIALKFDSLYWDIQDNNINWKQIDDVFDCSYDLISSVDYFISHLKSDHLVPGNIYHTLIGIADWSRTNKTTTIKQYRYVVLAISNYWDQRNLSNDPWFL